MIILIPNLKRSSRIASFRICRTRLSETYDRNWYHRQSFNATPNPWTRLDIRLYMTFDNILHKILSSTRLINYKNLIDPETEIQNLQPSWNENSFSGNIIREVLKHSITVAVVGKTWVILLNVALKRKTSIH